MSDEADLSTEQAGARAPSRVSRAHGDAGRPQGAGQPPRQGPVEAERLALDTASPFSTVGGVEDRRSYTILAARKDFVAANAGRRAPTPGFLLLVRVRAQGPGDDDLGLRAGFTVTKKIGNAVVRNRLKRRLRAAVRAVLPAAGIAGADHVLIGRSAGLTRDFAALKADLVMALTRCR